MRWEGRVARMGEKRKEYMSLAGKPERKRPLRRSRHMWIDNNKMEPHERGLNVVDWIGLAQDRYSYRALLNAVMILNVLYIGNYIYCKSMNCYYRFYL
jgi:hypothetical protein